MGHRRLKGKERHLFRGKTHTWDAFSFNVYAAERKGQNASAAAQTDVRYQNAHQAPSSVFVSLDCAVQTRHFYGAEFLSPDLWVTGASKGRKDTCSGEEKPLGMLLVLIMQQSGRGKMPLQPPQTDVRYQNAHQAPSAVFVSLDCAVQTRHFYGAEFLSPDLWVTGASGRRIESCSRKRHTWDAFSFDYAAERKGQNASAAAPD